MSGKRDARGEQCVDVADDEVGVFEVSQQGQVERDPDDEERPLGDATPVAGAGPLSRLPTA